MPRTICLVERSNQLGGRPRDCGIRSLKQFKKSDEYRLQLRQAIEEAHRYESRGSDLQRYRARLDRFDAETELDRLDRGCPGDPFSGFVRLEVLETE